MAKKKPAKRSRRKLDPYQQTAVELGIPLTSPEVRAQTGIVAAGVETKPGLLESVASGLRGMFDLPSQSPQPEAAAAASSLGSENSSTVPGKTSETITADAERKLTDVPDVIGEPVEASGSAEETTDETLSALELSRVDALCELGYFDKTFAAEALDDIFGGLADRFESEHWKLKPERRDKIARPLCAVMNETMDAVMSALPGAAGDAARSHPEFAMLAVALGSAVLPRALKQVRISRARAASGERKPAQPDSPRVVKVATGRGDIPVFTGTFGGSM